MHFCVKQLSRLKKSEGKNTIFYSFSVLPTAFAHSHGENLHGFIAQETKDWSD